MPQAASTLDRDPFLRVLLLGAAKVGKSRSTIVSLAAIGPGYVLCCGDRSGMGPAARHTKKFAFDVIRDENDMEACLKEARRGVKENEYKWIVVDDFSLYASFLEGALRDASASHNSKGEPDGRRYWPEYKQRLLNTVRRLFDVKAHVVFISHYIESGPEIDGQRAKTGRGIMPMVGGSAREELPALFQDVLFMEKEDKSGRRVFQVNPEGVWGPGSRSSDGTHTIDADFGEFLKLAVENDKTTTKGKIK
jgi:AAA domain